MEFSFEIENTEHKCKCRICSNNIYPDQLRANITGYENLYWADNYEGKVNEIKNFYIHLNCLIEFIAEKGIELRKEKYEEEIEKLETIKQVADK